jgi:signal transduction histidine kinase
VAPKDGRFLVVDDNDASRFAHATVLRREGHTVFEAGRIREAEQMIRDYRPDVVVLDINLPDGNGLDFCRRIKKDDSLRGLMVLQMSASMVTPEDAAGALDAGADAYIAEPVPANVLVATARAMLRLSRAERALTETVAREQEARAEAEAANRLKDDFLATLSHELRTPLNAIIGWTTLIRTMPMDDAAIKEAVNVIERNAKAQATLIDDLLDVARIAQGQMQLANLPVHLPAIVAASIDTIRPAADAKDIAVNVHIRSSPMLTLRGDPVRMQQVVWNLLSNAVKFTPTHGRIDVSVTADDQAAELTVADNGRGVRPELLPRIFDRFRRGDDQTPRVGGLGLGLAIARQLVEMHGGTLTAWSAGENQGTTFTVRVPHTVGASRPRTIATGD